MTLPTRKRWWITAAVLVALVVLLVVALYAALATIDVADHRSQIEALVSHSLDREVKIGGAIELDRSLRPRFIVEQVSVANPSWATRPLLASIARLEIQVALLALLQRRLEIVELRIVGADIQLERRRDGTPNWVLGRQDAATGKPGMIAEVLSLGVKRSTMVYRDPEGVKIEAMVENVETQLAPGQPVHARLQGRYQQIPIDVQLDGDNLEKFLAPETVWKFRGKVALGGLRGDIQGSATEPLKLAGMDLSFQFHGASAGAWRSRLTDHVPQLADYRGAGRFTSGRDGYGFDVRADGSDLELAKLWSGRDAASALTINAQHIELSGHGNAATLSGLLTRAGWQLRAQGAELRWRHSDTQPPLVLSATDVTAQTQGGTITLGMQGNVAGKSFTAEGTLGALGLLLAEKMPWTIEAAVEMDAAHGKFQGVLRKPLARPGFDGSFTVSAEQLSTLGALAGLALPARGPVQIAGQFTLADSNLQLSGLDVRVAHSRVRGAIAWQTSAAPRVRIQLAPSRVYFEDLRDDTTPAGAPQDDRGGADDGRVIPDFPLVGEGLRRASVELTLDHLELADAKTVLASLTGQVQVADGRLTVGPFRSDVAGAPIEVRLVLDASHDPATLDADIDAQSIDYGALLRATGVADGAQGQLDLRLRLAGAGNSLRPLLQTAAGSIELVGGEGRLRGKLLELWGGNLMQILNPEGWMQGADTELNCLAGRFQVRDGSARSDLLLLDSSNVTVAGELVLDLKTEAINGLFKSQPKQATLVKLGQPLQLSGTLKTPKLRPADRGVIVTLGKIAIGIAQPAALIVMFGDLGAKEKNPCAALLAQPAAGARPDAGGRN
jgi:AsmA family protein